MQIQITLDGKKADETKIGEFERRAYMRELNRTDNSLEYDFNWEDEEDACRDLGCQDGRNPESNYIGTIIIMD